MFRNYATFFRTVSPKNVGDFVLKHRFVYRATEKGSFVPGLKDICNKDATYRMLSVDVDKVNLSFDHVIDDVRVTFAISFDDIYDCTTVKLTLNDLPFGPVFCNDVNLGDYLMRMCYVNLLEVNKGTHIEYYVLF